MGCCHYSTLPCVSPQRPCTVFLKQHQCSEGKTKPIFMCKCQSVSSQQSQPRLLPRLRARRRLNNLAARCHCAQGSQPSKVMTESAPQIPPIHFHYHLFTALESSQTKPKASWGMEISRTVQTVSQHIKKINKYTTTFSQRIPPEACTRLSVFYSHTFTIDPGSPLYRTKGAFLTMR